MNKELDALPLTDAVLEVGWFEVADFVAAGSTPVPLLGVSTLLIIDVATGDVIGSDVLRHASMRTFARAVVHQLLNPAAPRQAGRPAEVRVATVAARRAVRNEAGGAIPGVLVADVSPLMQHAARSLVTFLIERARESEQALAAGVHVPDKHDATPLAPGTLAENPFTASASVEARSPEELAFEALFDLHDLAAMLPGTDALLDRLAWGFFFDGVPTPSDVNDKELLAAYGRFLDWAVFAARVEKYTLAERVVELHASAFSEDELSLRRRLANPRAGYFKVSKVYTNSGFDVLDVQFRDTLRVLAADDSKEIRKGETLLGMVHPISDSQWIFSPSLVAVSGPVKNTPIGKRNVQDFGPETEEDFFGASPKWLQEVPAEDVRQAYTTFRKALSATGTKLPTLNALTKRIAVAPMPSDILKGLVDSAWWNDNELQVFIGFVMRLWNETPRPELGGRSPLEMPMSGEREASPPERRRAPPPASARRRR